MHTYNLPRTKSSWSKLDNPLFDIDNGLRPPNNKIKLSLILEADSGRS